MRWARPVKSGTLHAGAVARDPLRSPVAQVANRAWESLCPTVSPLTTGQPASTSKSKPLMPASVIRPQPPRRSMDRGLRPCADGPDAAGARQGNALWAVRSSATSGAVRAEGVDSCGGSPSVLSCPVDADRSPFIAGRTHAPHMLACPALLRALRGALLPLSPDEPGIAREAGPVLRWSTCRTRGRCRRGYPRLRCAICTSRLTPPRASPWRWPPPRSRPRRSRRRRSRRPRRGSSGRRRSSP